jgi:hypothetical protein
MASGLDCWLGDFGPSISYKFESSCELVDEFAHFDCGVDQGEPSDARALPSRSVTQIDASPDSDRLVIGQCQMVSPQLLKVTTVPTRKTNQYHRSTLTRQTRNLTGGSAFSINHAIPRQSIIWVSEDDIA